MDARILNYLRALAACHEGIAFVSDYDTPQQAWDSCTRPEWMLWWLGRKPALKQQLVELAATFAEHVLPIWEGTYPRDNRPHLAIEAARTWIINPEISKIDVARASHNARAATSDAAERPFGLAWAASAAASAAVSAAACHVYDTTIIYACWAAVHSIGASADRMAECKWQCDEIRRMFPEPLDINNQSPGELPGRKERENEERND